MIDRKRELRHSGLKHALITINDCIVAAAALYLCDVADVKTTCSHISSYKDRCLASLEALESIFTLSLCLVTVDRGSREAL
jgi:hypothetical protein